MSNKQAIQIYAGTCRDILKEGSASYSKLFFDDHIELPDLAFLRSFEMSSVRGLVHDWLVYFEVHLNSVQKEGVLSVCTLEVGPTLVRSTPSQNKFQISGSSNAFKFETTDEKHHLKGVVEFIRNEDDCVLRFRTAEYFLTLIHPGTKKPTKSVNVTELFASIRSEITCPKCLGKGDFYSMSIPESSYKSGLSGYALYSENTICCHTGCALCGGSGMSYEEWYVKEKAIDIKTIDPLVRGAGRVVIGDNIVKQA